jgi:hypothetical protein
MQLLELLLSQMFGHHMDLAVPAAVASGQLPSLPSTSV